MEKKIRFTWGYNLNVYVLYDVNNCVEDNIFHVVVDIIQVYLCVCISRDGQVRHHTCFFFYYLFKKKNAYDVARVITWEIKRE